MKHLKKEVSENWKTVKILKSFKALKIQNREKIEIIEKLRPMKKL